MHSEIEPPQTLTFPLIMERMLIIDEGQEPHLVSHSPTIRSTIANVGIKARLAKAWKMML